MLRVVTSELAISRFMHKTKRGLLFSVAGRRGRSHFACVTMSSSRFFNIGIRPSGELLIDGVDEQRDVRNMEGVEKNIREIVHTCLTRN